MKVCWFSTGVSSFLACLLTKDVDKILYTHVENQHPDSIRFLHDCEKVLGREIEILQSKRFTSVEDVIRKTRYINGPRGASCTKRLKRDVRRQWELEHPEHHTYVWGFDLGEKQRASRILESMPDYDHEFPLIEKGLTKQDVHGIAERLIRRPLMYDLGFPNNNCIACVKGGMGYWNLIRKHFPEVFAERAKLEREIGHSCINGMFLDELPPDKGNVNLEIMEDCSLSCYIVSKELYGL